MAAKKMPSKKMPDPVKSKPSAKTLVQQGMKLGVDPTKYVKKKK